MMQDVNAWRGRKAIGCDGHKVGKIGEIYLDRSSGEPAWAEIGTGLFGMRKSFVPLGGATAADDGEICLSYTRDQIKDAPHIAADGGLSPAQEERLYRHYGARARTDERTPDDGREDRFSHGDERGIRWGDDREASGQRPTMQ